jgi:esterase/lipase superfamily enzyme
VKTPQKPCFFPHIKTKALMAANNIGMEMSMIALRQLLAASVFIFLGSIPSWSQARSPEPLIRAYLNSIDIQAAGVPPTSPSMSIDFHLVVGDVSADDVLGELKKLGSIVSIKSEISEAFSEFTIYKTTATHEKGYTYWQFSIADGTIKRAQLGSIVPAYLWATPIQKSGQDTSVAIKSITGISVKDIREHGLLGGPNSDAKSFSKIFGTSFASEKTLGSSWGDNELGGVLVGQAPNVPAPSAAPPLSCSGACPSVVTNRDSRLVEFFFVTDRKPNGTSSQQTFTHERHVDSNGTPSMTYGIASVHVPQDHKIGRIELPSSSSFFGVQLTWEKEKEQKHFIVKKMASLSAPDWDQLVRGAKKKTALIFVHGFNTSFNDAVLRCAQMTWDLQYDGLSVLYSWSSMGQAADYLYDRDSALFARRGFIQLIDRLSADGIETINVIAHSMGNLAVVEALSTSASSIKPVSIDQLVMASPDLAADGFTASLSDLSKVTKGMTLYASSADKALILSAQLASFPRAGGVGPNGPIVHSLIDTIDVTAVGDELLGLNHTEFATNRSVMNDVKILIDKREKAPRLAEIRRYPEPPEVWRYYRYAP